MYNFLVKSNGHILYQGKRQEVYFGDTLHFPAEIGEPLLNNCPTAELHLVSITDDDELQTPRPKFNDIVSNLIQITNQRDQRKDYYPEVSIPVGTHWTQILAYLNNLEAAYPVDMILAKAVADKFPNYAQIQATYQQMVGRYSYQSDIPEEEKEEGEKESAPTKDNTLDIKEELLVLEVATEVATPKEESQKALEVETEPTTAKRTKK